MDVQHLHAGESTHARKEPQQAAKLLHVTLDGQIFEAAINEQLNLKVLCPAL